ncbi:MAG: histidine--tRNA ligase [Bdellovibrionales bacterium]|jgi:histidyl-tRNA synthetase|nr:histidine--tRNA ligase [Bdellovibrionales bacterium]
MSLSKKPYKGTRDFFPKDKRALDYIFSVMRKTAFEFGYESYDGPLLEEVDLYRAKSGEELINDQIYNFLDRGNREVAIRPEMTPTVARMVALIHREEAKPIRWFSIPNLMRYEKPQKGRLREHWQFNCDIFGAPEGHGELEILTLVIKLLKNFGANETQFEILINDRRVVDYIIKEKMNLDEERSYKLYKIIDKSKKVSPEALEKMVDELNLDQDAKNVFNKYLAVSSFGDMLHLLKSEGAPQERIEDLVSFSEKLDKLELIKYFRYDPTIVRGLDYYTGMVFEVYDKHPDNRRAISGGGSYSDLLKIFNEAPMPGVGFGLGDVTLKDFLEIHKLLPNFETPENDIFITYQTEKAEIEAIKLANSLREKGLRVVIHFGELKFKKIFGLAEKKGAQWVALMGEDEFNQQKVQIKNLSTRDQKEFSLSDIDSIYSNLK